MEKQLLEDEDSWILHFNRQGGKARNSIDSNNNVRYLKHHHRHRHRNKNRPQQEQEHPWTATDDAVRLEAQREQDFWTEHKERQTESQREKRDQEVQHEALLESVYRDPGISDTTVHGIMIDAGSTGSRLHVYEWKPRILVSPQDITAAVSGEMLSFPGTESRWTDRLRPGLAEFAKLLHNNGDQTNGNDTGATIAAPTRTPEQVDAQLDAAIGDYLKPLLEFAKSVLHTKRAEFGNFPLYLRATAGMRILPAADRARVMASVRRVLRTNTTLNPFGFTNDEQARTLSGEEEAIYNWAGVNFLVGDLIPETKGAGTVNPRRPTHGALDLGGGSTQISFFEPSQDIMSNLFKLHIGQAKHWNVYSHSFLFYGMNEAIHRHGARLTAGKSSRERIVNGVYDPCMPKGGRMDIRSNIHLTPDGKMETWNYYNESFPSGNGYYQATLYNDGSSSVSDVDACFDMAKDLLHLDNNAWCDFGHQGDCSFAGIYQPPLPKQNTELFGEFIAFSNYHHVWKFLGLPQRATIGQLYVATQKACALNLKELKGFVGDSSKIDEADLPTFCFRSAYTFQLLHNGYGFQLNDTIKVHKVLNGQKVGWALGAMLYEINALPWSYSQEAGDKTGVGGFRSGSARSGGDWTTHVSVSSSLASDNTLWLVHGLLAMVVVLLLVGSVGLVYLLRWRRLALYRQHQLYEPIKNEAMI